MRLGSRRAEAEPALEGPCGDGCEFWKLGRRSWTGDYRIFDELPGACRPQVSRRRPMPSYALLRTGQRRGEIDPAVWW